MSEEYQPLMNINHNKTKTCSWSVRCTVYLHNT